MRVGPGFDQKQEDCAFRAPNGAALAQLQRRRRACAPRRRRRRAGARGHRSADALLHRSSTTRAPSPDGRTVITVESRETPDHTELNVAGRIRVGDEDVVSLRRVAHPDLYTANAFRELLSRRGIKISGNVVRDTTPSTAHALTAHYSQPLGVVVRDVNKHSNNFMAEQILKTLGAETGGRPGTWQMASTRSRAFSSASASRARTTR